MRKQTIIISVFAAAFMMIGCGNDSSNSLFRQGQSLSLVDSDIIHDISVMYSDATNAPLDFSCFQSVSCEDRPEVTNSWGIPYDKECSFWDETYYCETASGPNGYSGGILSACPPEYHEAEAHNKYYVDYEDAAENYRRMSSYPAELFPECKDEIVDASNAMYSCTIEHGFLHDSSDHGYLSSVHVYSFAYNGNIDMIPPECIELPEVLSAAECISESDMITHQDKYINDSDIKKLAKQGCVEQLKCMNENTTNRCKSTSGPIFSNDGIFSDYGIYHNFPTISITEGCPAFERLLYYNKLNVELERYDALDVLHNLSCEDYYQATSNKEGDVDSFYHYITSINSVEMISLYFSNREEYNRRREADKAAIHYQVSCEEDEVDRMNYALNHVEETVLNGRYIYPLLPYYYVMCQSMYDEYFASRK